MESLQKSLQYAPNCYTLHMMCIISVSWPEDISNEERLKTTNQQSVALHINIKKEKWIGGLDTLSESVLDPEKTHWIQSFKGLKSEGVPKLTGRGLLTKKRSKWEKRGLK